MQAYAVAGMVRRMGAVRRACTRLGIAATISLILALVVMMFVFEAPQVATWFLASAALAAGSFMAAVLAALFEL